MKRGENIHLEALRPIHEYTRSEAPWKLEAYGKKLFRYLSGGGMSALGRSVEQEEADMKRSRFLAWAAVAGAVWFAFMIF